MRVPDRSTPVGFREVIAELRGKDGGIWRTGYSRVNHMEETNIRLILFCCAVITSDRVLVARGRSWHLVRIQPRGRIWNGYVGAHECHRHWIPFALRYLVFACISVGGRVITGIGTCTRAIAVCTAGCIFRVDELRRNGAKVARALGRRNVGKTLKSHLVKSQSLVSDVEERLVLENWPSPSDAELILFI